MTMIDQPKPPAWVYPSRRVGGSIVYAVPHPKNANAVLWCAPCVIAVGCPQCRSSAGVPCLGTTRYVQDTHWMRRDLYRTAKRHNFKLTKQEFELIDARIGCKVPRKMRPPSQ